MEQYPAIAEHGLIGDLQTAAPGLHGRLRRLVRCPRFDSPEHLRRLLDRDEGGCFRIAVRGRPGGTASSTSPTPPSS